MRPEPYTLVPQLPASGVLVRGHRAGRALGAAGVGTSAPWRQSWSPCQSRSHRGRYDFGIGFGFVTPNPLTVIRRP
jgi:hypothetical protein